MVVNNNKGYMLVEVVLASVIAFGIAYFLISMTINLKNKNDDIFVETVVATDQNIFAGIVMKKTIDQYKTSGIICNFNDVIKSGNEFEYQYFGDDANTKFIFNKYIDFYNNETSGDCKIDSNFFYQIFRMNVKQLPNKNFDVLIRYRR